MLRVGLTGGIASGKSTASRRFEELGARVIDHDVLAREAVEPGSAALADIVRRFGHTIIDNGALNRRELAAMVFGDPAALADLNAIVHPYVQSLGRAADRRGREDGVGVLVHAIPLLVEAGYGDSFDLVATVAAPEELRMLRLMEGRGMSRAEARARIDAQATDAARAAVADVVLDGSRDVGHLNAQVDRFWFDHIPVSVRARSLGE